ncbi:protein-glutamate methylesterase/protein-glutamine glutaminase [Symbiobacterium thermophilum]|uniref:Protein-glutamate methylesterase/protein-glutamine glutaminase n=1 Tax=Symbiobacterium thermophilum TaxID=2734 RepID=A0A953LJC6_SYMTR|nr:chemotaxis response regulator protein-glutamate methylesterase [Symbiobacterium thermophilum]MBY6276994.1 chemotaxis response regulator protein-glutamate methylesterase [Symbiobacterium thermophilum]
MGDRVQRPIRVLVVDDSAFMRKVLTELLESDPLITVVATARDGQDGLEKVLQLQPDVVTLDIEMPRLDGYGTLREIMARRPTPVVMVSSHTREGAEATIRALALGAVDFVAKPSGSISLNMHVARDELVAKVKAAAAATPRVRTAAAEMAPVSPREKMQALAGLRRQTGFGDRLPRRLVLIGCSTGGPGALHQIIPRLPADLPAGVLVVQHMPPGFTRSLAQRLDELSAISVREARAGDPVRAGQVLVAPGGYHMLVDAEGRIALDQGPPVHGVRPAVDVTFESVLPVWKDRLVGVILTGMGYDGAKGMAQLWKAGGWTIAEDASTCVVYGMPRVVVEMGAAREVLPVHSIADAITRAVGEG